MLYYIILGVALFFVLFQSIKFTIFLHMAIGRIKEKKKEKKNKIKKGAEGIYLRDSENSQKWLAGQQQEEIRILGFQDTELIGHFIQAKEQRRIILAFHGWRGDWNRDFSFAAKKLLEHGCSVLFVEQRAHGQSGGKYIGFGILERFDCLKWSEYLHERFGNKMPVYLYGVSMGASTVLMASSLVLPGNVRGIIADCGFTIPYAMVARFARVVLKRGEFPDVSIVNKLCRWRAGYDFKEYSTLEALKHCKLPVMFIHGKNDNFVPCSMTVENYKQCCSRKEIFLVEGADHCRSFYTSPEEYMSRLCHFFQWEEPVSVN